MNKRIKELIDQAQDWADAPAPYASEEHEYFAEKFAELIVRECIDCLKPLSRNHSMVGAAIDTIREHFGVE